MLHGTVIPDHHGYSTNGAGIGIRGLWQDQTGQSEVSGFQIPPYPSHGLNWVYKKAFLPVTDARTIGWRIRGYLSSYCCKFLRLSSSLPKVAEGFKS